MTSEGSFAVDHPILQRGSDAYGEVLERCKATLEAEGLVDVPEFLAPEAVAADVASVSPRMASEAFHHLRAHNIYFRDDIPGLPADHPALRQVETANRTLCADQLAGTHVMALYSFAPLRAFLADLMGKAALYEMDDPLARVNVMQYEAGQALNWHFDRSEFTVTVLLQAPEAGGVFEYRKDLRGADDPNYDGVARLIRGQDTAVQQHRPAPGTLTVFRGINTAHRVTPAQGATPRLVAVFSYFDQPGVRFSAQEQIGFYGRSAVAAKGGSSSTKTGDAPSGA